MELTDGSRVGVIGGGPAGSLTSYFLLEIAERIGVALAVDIYEPRPFAATGPKSCNMCGGIVSESLVQLLATEGINLPPEVVQRGIDSYVVHSQRQAVHLRTPLEEMRIASVYRAAGPRNAEPGQWDSFDDYLLSLACERGARRIAGRVEQIQRDADGMLVRAKDHDDQRFGLIVGAVGVNSKAVEMFEGLDFGFRKPATTRASISELHLGREQVQACLGNSMHVFLLDIPRLKFAALIPKGEYATMCLLGHEIDNELIDRFMNSPAVRRCLPADWEMHVRACRCMPRMNIGAARGAFGDRVVMVGDCGVSRLYKDGIGAAYRAAKACAVTAVCHGVSKRDFARHFQPTCKRLARDNRIGKLLFLGAAVCQKLSFCQRGMLHVADQEQQQPPARRLMSMVLWDMFTGSAPYRDILRRAVSPRLVQRLVRASIGALLQRKRVPQAGA